MPACSTSDPPSPPSRPTQDTERHSPRPGGFFSSGTIHVAQIELNSSLPPLPSPWQTTAPLQFLLCIVGGTASTFRKSSNNRSMSFAPADSGGSLSGCHLKGLTRLSGCHFSLFL